MKSIHQIKRVYYLITFLFWFATALPITLMVLIAQSRGIDLFELGTLAAVYSITIVLLEVPTGGLADSIGRKTMAILALAITILSRVLFVFAFSYSAFLIAWVFSGAGRALISGTLEAWFIDSLKEIDPGIDLQPALAQSEVFATLALALGVLLGGIIPNAFAGLPAEGTAVLTPFITPLVLSIGVMALTLIATLFLIKEHRQKPQGNGWKQGVLDAPKMVRDAAQLVHSNSIIALLLGSMFVSGLALTALEIFWQPFFADLLGGSEGNSTYFGVIMGGTFGAAMVGYLLSTQVSRWLKKRYGLVSAISQGLKGFFLLLLASQPDVVPSVTLFWLVYMSSGLLNSPHSTLLNNETPSDFRSSMLSLQSLLAYLGSAFGSLFLGYLAKLFSIPVAWSVTGINLVVSLFLYLRVDQIRKDKYADEPVII